MKDNIRQQVDREAAALLKLQGKAAELQIQINTQRAKLMDLVGEHGSRSPRARKTRAIYTKRYSVKLASRIEVFVDEQVVAQIKKDVPKNLFDRLYETMELYALRGNAHDVVGTCDKGTRSQFARSIIARDLTPALYVDPVSDRRRPRDEEAE